MASHARSAEHARAYDWANIAVVSVGSASAQSSAVSVAGDYELATDTDCYVLVGANPTAAASTSRFLAAGQRMTLKLAAGDKVAAIRKSADGKLSIVRLL